MMLSALILATIGGALVAAEPEPQDAKVRVTVVSILATSKDDKVDDKLKEVAKEVSKKSQELTGFRIATTSARIIALASKEKFAAVDENEVTVEVNALKDNGSRFSVQVKAPTLASLTYNCVPGKYLPIVTGYETKNGDRLIIAVMVEVPKGK